MLKCSGDANKREIVNEYWIKPVSRLRLLNGQIVDGCCGPLESEYYLFLATHKKNNNKEEVFAVGTHCAKEFLRLTKNNPLPLSDLFKFQGQPGVKGVVSNNDSSKKMHDLNRLLILAINVLCVSWRQEPKSLILKILLFTNSKPDEPNYNGILIFNKIIQKDREKRSLTFIYQELKINNNIKDISFSPLHDYVISQGDSSFYL